MRDSSNWTLGLGRLAGVPVRLHASVIVGVLFAVYIGGRASPDHDYWGYGLLAGLVWVGSLIVHQMGHLIAAGRIGAHVDRIVVGLLGDLSPAIVPHEPRREMVIALSGPIANAVVLLIVTPAMIVSGADLKDMLLSPLAPQGLLDSAEFWRILLKMTFWCNWLLLLVNVLPALPLDVGRAIYCGLRPALGDKGAIAAVARGGLLVTVIGLSLWACLAQQDQKTPVVPVWLPTSLLCLYLIFTAKSEVARLDDDEHDSDLLGYDFSQGYTSLEQTADAPRRREPNFIQRWLDKRRDEKRRRAREIEEEEERRVDEILARVKDVGFEALAPKNGPCCSGSASATETAKATTRSSAACTALDGLQRRRH